MVSLVTLPARSHSHPRQIIIIIHNIGGHTQVSLYPGLREGASSLCQLRSPEGCVLLPALSWPLWDLTSEPIPA